MDAAVQIARELLAFRSTASWSLAFKRALDIGFAVTLLVSLAPLTLLCALLIMLGDGGPILFWQRRVGLHGCEFWLPKLRSMHPGAEHMHDTVVSPTTPVGRGALKITRDPRVTRVGHVIRRLSIDEIPQLWSVLTGEMSMVGPRPALPSEVATYDASARQRLAVKPGLTCIWQVSGRGTIPFGGQLALDLEYIDRRTMWLDLKLMALTIPAVLSRRGAY
jgi:lipopolysaccharide/colanic/teichoic acid biosynthesis glycosyltransferase